MNTRKKVKTFERNKNRPHTQAVLEKGEKTRSNVIHNAIRCFAEKGYDGTSFQEIANNCNLSQAALLYHFKTKFGLFTAAIENIEIHRQQLRNARTVENEPSTQTNLAKDFSLSIENDPVYSFLVGELSFALLFQAESQVFLLLHYFAAFDPHFSKIFEKYRKNWEKQFAKILTEGKLLGLYQADINLQLFPRLFYEYTTGSITNLLAGRDEIPTIQSITDRIKLFISKQLY